MRIPSAVLAVLAVLSVLSVGAVLALALTAPGGRPEGSVLPAVVASAPVAGPPPRRAVPAPTPSATATRTATAAAGLARSAPVRLRVGSIGVDSGLVDLGLSVDGSLEVPRDGTSVGWFTGAPSPGQTGPAVVVGHVAWGGRPGVLSRLGEVRAGDEIEVTRADGDVVVFATTRVEQFAKADFPTAQVYGDTDHAGLRIITCGGEVDPVSGHYVDNVVVYARLVHVVSS